MAADAYVMDADMKKVADAIRAKAGTTDPLVFPDGMKTAIDGISKGAPIVKIRVTIAPGNLTSAGSKDVPYPSEYIGLDENFTVANMQSDIQSNKELKYIGTKGNKSKKSVYLYNATKIEIPQALYDFLITHIPQGRTASVGVRDKESRFCGVSKSQYYTGSLNFGIKNGELYFTDHIGRFNGTVLGATTDNIASETVADFFIDFVVPNVDNFSYPDMALKVMTY